MKSKKYLTQLSLEKEYLFYKPRPVLLRSYTSSRLKGWNLAYKTVGRVQLLKRKLQTPVEKRL